MFKSDVKPKQKTKIILCRSYYVGQPCLISHVNQQSRPPTQLRCWRNCAGRICGSVDDLEFAEWQVKYADQL